METTPLGYNVIINQRHKGLVYHNEIFQEIEVGDRLEGYIKLIRSEDNGIDVSLQPKGVKRLESGAQQILDVLKKSKGFLALHDKSEPSEIMRILNMSKKNFKNSVGILYKQRIISLAADGIRMIETK
jgi:predicted RNA-binding protein (virulence factor B family)